MSDPERSEPWARRLRVLLGRPRAAPAPQRRTVKVEAEVTAQVPRPPAPGGGLLARTPAETALAPGRIQLGTPAAPPRTVRGAQGRPMTVAQAADGSVTLVAPPPPVRVATFSGGGGKGAAMPGAVRALEQSGVLKDLQRVTGASVGSMTAAMIAAGATADEFAEIGNDPSVASTIKQGKNFAEVLFGGGLDGQGLEGLVRNSMTRCVGKRIVEYVRQQQQAGQPIAPEVLAVAHRVAGGKKGPTFGELRTLARFIPAIKEVSVSASFMTAVDPKTGKPTGDDGAQLMMFNADTQPDMEVAVAVHASAALPPVFKPVDIELADGRKARFQDGGVLNNAPTPESTADAPAIDPMPEERGMTFVFEDEAAREVLQGEAVPRRSRMGDWLTGTEHSAAEYAKNRQLADSPDGVVMLPLTFHVPEGKLGEKGEKKDFTGFLSGTTNFDMAITDKLQLQLLAEDATRAQLQASAQPQQRHFDTPAQMLMCLPRADLAALATDGFDGAADALAFRDAACADVAALQALARQRADATPQALAADPAVQEPLEHLQVLAGADDERQGFVARELNRGSALAPLLAALDRGPGEGDGEGEGPHRGVQPNPIVEAGHAVAEALRARAHAKRVLREVIYPKMVREDPKKPSGQLLGQIDARLRRADSPEEVDDALRMAIAHFRKKTDPLGLLGHRAFAAELERRLMAP
jgi:exoenzyme U